MSQIKKLNPTTASNVEMALLRKSKQKIIYPPVEKIRTLVVQNFPELGRFTALRFLEWAQKNEGGVIALPTGKTPEYFIKWVGYFLEHWKNRKIQKNMYDSGLDVSHKPDMKRFHFVQIDEFYPIKSSQHNSFYYYVKQYYIKGFGLDPKKALLIEPDSIGISKKESLNSIWPDHRVDLSLRIRLPRTKLEDKQKRVIAAIDQFCYEYDEKIKSLGGIGFFLGGIGPDGHIGFNVCGSDHNSTTRLTQTNYETQAASAGDLGGIEISRHRLVITIGLKTIVYNPDVTALIMAAGEAKAKIVQKAIQSERSLTVPASVLHGMANACFYLTGGAAKLLTERRYANLAEQKRISVQDTDRILTDCALTNKKPLNALNEADIRGDKEARLLINKMNDRPLDRVGKLARKYQKRILSTMQIPTNEVFLHTAPHHDDIMLGYLPYLVRLMREPGNTHYFNYLTSGFNAVTNQYMYKLLIQVRDYMAGASFEKLSTAGYFDPRNRIYRNKDVLHYLDGIASKNSDMRQGAQSRRMLRNIMEIFEDESFENLGNRLVELINYFDTQYAGKKDLAFIQQLKGMTREWEADILWGYFGFGTESVIHSRLGFYKGDIFTEEPEVQRDVMPFLDLLRKIKPTVVTVAFDPEGSGPDTHYKVLQAISTALKLYREETGIDSVRIWGYRNVWFRYHPAEANLFIPVTLNSMAVMNDSFLNAFASQADASFPSYEYDGPFSELAQKIQVEQYDQMTGLLGKDFFYHNPDSRMRSTRGLVYLKEMKMDEFFKLSRELRKTTENI